MYFNEYQSDCIITILKTHEEREKDLERQKMTKMSFYWAQNCLHLLVCIIKKGSYQSCLRWKLFIFYIHNFDNNSDKQHPQSGCSLKLNNTGIHSICETTYFSQLPTATYIKVSYIMTKIYGYSLAFLANTNDLLIPLKALKPKRYYVILAKHNIF